MGGVVVVEGYDYGQRDLTKNWVSIRGKTEEKAT